MTPPAVLVMAKQPVPGRVKTRLVPPCTHPQAARLAAAALSDSLDAVDALDPRRRVLVFDGDPTGWVRPGWEVRPQIDGSFDRRLAAAFGAADGPGLLIGMDTPQVTAADLAEVDLERHDAALGHAADGGWWLLGLRDSARAADVLHGVPMSTDHTGADQRARLAQHGLSVQLLRTLIDVDDEASAAVVAASAPRSAFAGQWRSLSVGLAAGPIR